MSVNNRVSSSKSAVSSSKNQNKIELVNCPRGGVNCKTKLSEINTFFSESFEYQQSKEYMQSIEYLKKAHEKTFELQASTCLNCAAMFRAEIVFSLEKIYDDLQRTSRGFFRKGRYKGSFLFAEETLNEWKKEQPSGEVRKMDSTEKESIKSKVRLG